MIKALQFAKTNVNDSHFSNGLCLALQHAYDCDLLRYSDLHYIRSWISKELGPHCFLHQWIRAKTNKAPDNATLYRTRLAWIDWMVQHLKETT